MSEPISPSDDLLNGTSYSASRPNPPSRSTSQRTHRFENIIVSHLPISRPDPVDEFTESNNRLTDFDPRHFTPSLHASLVSEILSLRREAENKGNLITGLEEQLSSAEHDKAQLNDTLNGIRNECHDLRRLLQSLEGGSESALQKLTQERNAANETASEVKRRLEVNQKKLRTREEEIDRINSLWESDKQQWNEQRLVLDRKVHTVESRSRLLAQELETTQDRMGKVRFNSSKPNSRPQSGQAASPSSRNSDIRSSQSRQRNGSADSHDIRTELLPDDFLKNDAADTSRSLADELGLDYGQNDPDEGFTSDEALSEENEAWARPFSSQSNHELAKAHKVLGLNTIGDKGTAFLDTSQANDQILQGDNVPKTLNALHDRQSYRDMATQWSLSSSPSVQHESLGAIPEPAGSPKHISTDSGTQISSFYNPDGDGKRSPIPTVTNQLSTVTMISQGCQTIDFNLSSPATLRSSRVVQEDTKHSRGFVTSQRELPENLVAGKVCSEMKYEDENSPATAVPSSVLHQHGDDNSSSNTCPQSQDVGCQVENLGYKSRSVQTFPLPIPDGFDGPVAGEQRLSSLSNSNETEMTIIADQNSTPGDHVSNVVKPSENGDDSRQYHLSDSTKKYISSIQARDNDAIKNIDTRIRSEPVKATALANFPDNCFEGVKPVKKKLTKTEDGWISVTVPDAGNNVIPSHAPPPSRPPPSPPTFVNELTYVETSSSKGNVASGQGADSDMKTADHKSTTASIETIYVADGLRDIQNGLKRSRETDIRKQALISSGSAVHLKRSQSPSARTPSTGDMNLDPPFPVPDRSSSKKLPSESDSLSPIEGSVTFFSGGIHDKKTTKKTTNRARSASVSSRSFCFQKENPTQAITAPNSNIPDGSSVVSEAYSGGINVRNSTRQMGLPSGNIIAGVSSQCDSDSQHSSNIAPAHDSGVSGPTNVVDAIAQTMVGEWMWKYVRRRKSFGLPETPTAEFELGKNSDINAARHRRWVWLAPYERAVMWSSKQPTSGPALMGKTGRKLIIRSVLDVKDDTPLPKSAENPTFGRSILVLTAQRALKFTALNRERHFVWLTALSFLSHSSVIPQTLATKPPTPNKDSLFSPPVPFRVLGKRQSAVSLRRNRNHDSTKATNERSKFSLNSIVDEKNNFSPSASGEKLHPEVSSARLAIEDSDSESKAAEAPLVPRFATHSRKRSNTGMSKSRHRSFKGFANTQAGLVRPKADEHSDSAMDKLSNAGGWVTDGGRAVGSSFLKGYRKTEAQQDTHHHAKIDDGAEFRHEVSIADNMLKHNERPTSGNFFEAIGTVRMEAFVRGLDQPEDMPTKRRSHRIYEKQTSSAMQSKSRGLERVSSQGSLYRHEEQKATQPIYWQ